MAEIKEKFYAKLGNFEPDKCNAYSVISRVDYEAIMQRIIQLQDKTIKKEKRDYWIISRFDVLGGGCKGALRGTPPFSPPLSTPLPTAPPPFILQPLS